jgi:hypothetical protein
MDEAIIEWHACRAALDAGEFDRQGDQDALG